jgi:acyl carrier protein
MEIQQIEELVIKEVLKSLRDDKTLITSKTLLTGDAGVVDSIVLIELCVGLEDRASELGFEFDWTSDSAMSRSRSMFSSVESLAKEFYNQLKEER